MRQTGQKKTNMRDTKNDIGTNLKTELGTKKKRHQCVCVYVCCVCCVSAVCVCLLCVCVSAVCVSAVCVSAVCVCLLCVLLCLLCVSAVCVCCVCLCWSKICVFPRTLRPSAPPPPDRPSTRTAQNFALFFPSPTSIFIFFFSLWGSSRVFFSLSGCLLVSFFLSLGVFSLNFGGVMIGRDLKCLFSPSRCSVEPRRPAGRRGLPHDNQRTPNAHI